MRLAITGGTGFVGSQLVRRFDEGEHEFVLLARGEDHRNEDLLDRSDVQLFEAGVGDTPSLREAFTGCEVVAHLAGINHERGEQTYQSVHVDGTENVVEAAIEANVSKLVLTSYLRARPDCGCGYHESKWEAETIVRRSGLEYTVLKPGVIYGPGDQMTRSVVRALSTAPVFPRIGFGERSIRPVAIDDVVDVLCAAIVDRRLSNSTVPIVGPEELSVSELVKRIGETIDRRPLFVPVPVRMLLLGSRIQEAVLETPLVTTAGVRMLAEGPTAPVPASICDPLPKDLQATRSFSPERIEAALPRKEPIGLDDIRI